MPFNPSSYPYSAIVYIRDTLGSQNFQASGVLLSPDEVLTASHVVYSQSAGTATNIVVTPGYDAGSSPFGSAFATYVHTVGISDSNGLLSFADSQSDYAVIHLSHPIATAGTMGLLANFGGGAVHATGYPTSAGGRMTDIVETVILDPEYSLLVGIDTGSGSSGGPVWILGSDGLPYVVGTVSGGNPAANKGYNTQITAAAYNQIEAWIAQDDGTNNQIAGTAGDDVFSAGGVSSSFSGNGGHDTLRFHGTRANYTIATNGTAVIATDTVQNRDGVSQTITVEHLQFTDVTLYVENAENAAIARLYAAALGRVPDPAGLNYWENIYMAVSPAAKASGAIVALAQTDIGGVLASIAAGFTGSAEFQQKYGALSDSAFVTQLYQNVLSRAPDAGGFAYWSDAIHSGQTHEMALVGFAQSPESAAKIAAAGWLLAV